MQLKHVVLDGQLNEMDQFDPDQFTFGKLNFVRKLGLEFKIVCRMPRT